MSDTLVFTTLGFDLHMLHESVAVNDYKSHMKKLIWPDNQESFVILDDRFTMGDFNRFLGTLREIMNHFPEEEEVQFAKKLFKLSNVGWMSGE